MRPYALLTIALAVAPLPQHAALAADPRPFQVGLADCTEFAGLAPVPAANVAWAVPSAFVPLAPSPGTATVVARISRCQGISVDGARPVPGTVSHVGVSVVSPDGSGDINNYTVLYVTDNTALAERLRGVGLPVRIDSGLTYEVTPASSGLELFGAVDPGPGEIYALEGAETDPPAGATQPFLANWWYQGPAGRVLMATDIPAIGFGSSSVGLYTSLESLVGRLTGAHRTLFPLLSVRGRFSSATMTVSVHRR
jgi:hypothetical protein